MKRIKTIVLCALAVMLSIGGHAQTQTKSKSSSKAKTNTAPVKKAAPPAPPAPGKSLTVALNNKSEKTVLIFSGLRQDLKDPKSKIKTIGGLGKNTLYVRVNEVVCIMDDKQKPIACTDIKDATTTVEINPAANGISSK